MAEMTVEAIATELEPAIGGDVADYVVLMKPRVMFLVVFTAVVGLVA
ncbi:MAG: protoheme IX farnesyltransferase, partial [Actinomycetota bacterium]